MEDQTQAVIDGDERVDDEENISPVGYLRVLAQKDLDQADYPIPEGEVTLGRGSECELVIAARSLSRKHATVLVEGGTHFVQDLDSRNKTYRRMVQLRPNAFYELTHGCELTFADVKCVYYIGSLPEEGEEEGEESDDEAAANDEATQAYGMLDDEEEEGEGEKAAAAQDDADGEEESDATDGDEGNAEPTQAYHFDADDAEEEEEDGEAEPMECDATVAYNISDEREEQSDADKDEDSAPSSPILVATKQIQQKAGASSKPESGASTTEAKKPTKKVCFASESGSDSTDGGAEDPSASKEGDETDGDETNDEVEEQEDGAEKKTEKSEAGEKDSDSEATAAMKRTESKMEVDECDPTVAYNLETDEEKTDSEEGGESEEKKREAVEPTVPYDLKDEGEDSNGSVKEKETEDKKEGGGSSSKAEGETDSESKGEAAVKAPEKDSQDTEDEGDTEAVESSTTEAESQEVKEKPTHLRVPKPTLNAKTLSAMSVDSVDQATVAAAGGGTVLLESYESSCDDTAPLNAATTLAATVKKEATVEAMDSTTVDVKTDTSERRDESESAEPEAGGGATAAAVKEEKDSDASDVLIPELGSKGTTGGRKHSKQKTLFDVVSSKRGRGRGRGRGQGRKATATRGETSKKEEPSVDDGDTSTKQEKADENGPEDVKRETTKLLAEVKTEEGKNGESERTTSEHDVAKTSVKAMHSIGGISGRVANLRLKTLSCISPPDVGVSDTSSSEAAAPPTGRKASRRGRGRGGKRTASRRTGGRGTIDPAHSIDTTASATLNTVDEESPDLGSLSKDDQSEPTKMSCDQNEDDDTPSDHSSATSSGLESARGGRGKRGRGRGGASKRGKAAATPKRKSTEPAAKPRTPSLTPTLCLHRTPTSASRLSSKSPSSSPKEKPKIMFTGLIDKTGEKTVRELGGELVDSVYQCTHLVTDKVRRTVKFLCCLSRGCLIVSDAWLDECAVEKRFIPAEPYLVRDKAAERQHKFTLQRSHETAKVTKLLDGYKVYLTPHVKPEREQMSDIIKCSGGQAFDYEPSLSPDDKVVVVSCEEDLGMCRAALDAGVAVHSTELILGGVLRQELDLHSHLMTPPTTTSSAGTGRKRRAKESSLVPAAKRKRK